jgi:aminoglycoside/choline kinase family phosphotransferase
MTTPVLEADEAVRSFLARSGWEGASLHELEEAGASLRRYQRVRHPSGRSAILTRVDNPELEITQFIAIAGLLRSMKLSAPEIYAQDTEQKLLLQEDFGSSSYAQLIERGTDPLPLYLQATDVLLAIQSRFRVDLPGAQCLPNYDFLRWHSILSENLKNFYVHYLPCVGAPALSEAEQDEYWRIWKAAYAKQDSAPATLLMRDYKPANLMQLPARSGVNATGLIDFQDAGVGSPFYDLIELCEPWRHPQTPAIRAAVLARYSAGRPELSLAQIESGLMTLGAMRWIGWLSNCARYARQGRPQFLANIPHIWRAADVCLADPALDELRRWFAQYAPIQLRAPQQVAA